jgi:phosphocarrier protein
MAKIKLIVENINGVHARPAAEIVKAAGEYPSCEVSIQARGAKADARSIMGILMLKILHQTEVEITAVGEGEEEVIAKMEQLFKDKFGFEE